MVQQCLPSHPLFLRHGAVLDVLVCLIFCFARVATLVVRGPWEHVEIIFLVVGSSYTCILFLRGRGIRWKNLHQIICEFAVGCLMACVRACAMLRAR